MWRYGFNNVFPSQPLSLNDFKQHKTTLGLGDANFFFGITFFQKQLLLSKR